MSHRTTHAAMCHHSLDLTMDVYTAPTLLDVAGTMDVLPEAGATSAGKDTARGDAC